MDFVAAILLGAVQGVTEFLPISSSAHLILAKEFFGWDTETFGLAFDVACHVGTLLAVVVFFRADITAMFRALPQALSPTAGPDGHRIRLIVVGTIPIVIVGLLFADAIEASTRTPVVAATALLLGAGLLFLIERMRPQGGDDSAMSLGSAFTVGIAQAAALIPGVSRSGATIATGMALGLRRDIAARFAFLLSVPAVAAAGVKEALVLRGTTFGQDEAVLFLTGLLVSAIVGYLTVRFFVRFLTTHSLDVFAWYRVALALATFAWLATGGGA